MDLIDLTSSQVDSLDRETPVILPVAAIEQHASHLPLATDSLLLEEVVRRSKKSCSQDALFLPLMWLGNSHHHLDFSGTLSAPPRVWMDLLSGLIDNVLQHGFKRILVVNGHGGNCVPISQTLFEQRQKRRDCKELMLLSATYWTLGEPPFDNTAISRDVAPAGSASQANANNWAQCEMGHACEWETSMMLVIAKEKVGDYLSLPDVPMTPSFERAERAWVTQDRTEKGYIGMPRQANEAKGEALLNAFANGLTDLITEISRREMTTW